MKNMYLLCSLKHIKTFFANTKTAQRHRLIYLLQTLMSVKVKMFILIPNHFPSYMHFTGWQMQFLRKKGLLTRLKITRQGMKNQKSLRTNTWPRLGTQTDLELRTNIQWTDKDWGRQGLFKDQGKGTQLRTIKGRADKKTRVIHIWGTRVTSARQNKTSNKNKKRTHTDVDVYNLT